MDAYLNVIRETDPLKTSLVFSCGMGAVRTTYAMVAACIVRRKRVMELGWADPFGLASGSTFNVGGTVSKGANTPTTRSDTPLGAVRSGAVTVSQLGPLSPWVVSDALYTTAQQLPDTDGFGPSLRPTRSESLSIEVDLSHTAKYVMY